VPWVVGVGLLGAGAAAIYFWYRSSQTPPDDGLGPDGEPLPDGGGTVEDTEPGGGPGAAAVAGTAGATAPSVSDETMPVETRVDEASPGTAEPSGDEVPPQEPPRS